MEAKIKCKYCGEWSDVVLVSEIKDHSYNLDNCEININYDSYSDYEEIESLYIRCPKCNSIIDI
jgi:DNA-directed RNA polymerase subunit RPC12/RpoP